MATAGVLISFVFDHFGCSVVLLENRKLFQNVPVTGDGVANEFQLILGMLSWAFTFIAALISMRKLNIHLFFVALMRENKDIWDSENTETCGNISDSTMNNSMTDSENSFLLIC
ncbi:hypothetical protein L1987_87394 [Smallanthus sonchifolius]|nr:hypothetical protein L1987_87394 [Smallanthus sonchifolius]